MAGLYRYRYFLFPVLLLLGACQTTGQPDRATMAMGFAEAAYGLGVEPEGNHAVVYRTRLIRWDRSKAVRLTIDGEDAGSPLYTRIVEDMQGLYRLASLNLQPGFTSTDQLLTITVSDDPLLVTDQIKTRCYTVFHKTDVGYLKSVEIVASRGVLDEGASNCLLHEGMHSLGFNGHPHRLDSLLSYTRDQNALTEIDRRLIDMLYHPQLADAIPLGEALTFAYIEFSGFREQRSRRYTPLDISLEVTEEESPLVLKPPFMANTSHQFYYKTSKIGNQSTKASYGLRGAGQKFAEMTHATLASGYVFTAQPEVSEFARAHESYLGPVTERSLGQVEHDLGHFNYAIVDSPSHSCVFTIKHISTGRDSRFHGGYCRDVERPMLRDDAIAFILAIEIRDRDPVRLREERMSSRQAARNDFVAISLIGKWPLTDSYISGLKLIARGMTSGKMLIEIDGETCQGLLTDIDTSGLGKWSVECRDTEDASGRFSWERDGTLSFRGETTQSAQEIHWTAYPVF